MRVIKKFLGFISREETLVFILSFSLILISIFPTVSFYLNTPRGHVYSFLHNSVSDYPYYLSFIRQGTFGRITTIDQFTTEPQTAGLIHIFYLWLGLVGGFFSLPPALIYFIARIIFGFIFIITAYLFISFFLRKKWQRILAYIFFTTSASFPNFVNNAGHTEIWPFIYWWTEIDPLRRATFIPHFLVGHIGLAGGLLLLILLYRTGKLRFLLLAIVLGLITGISHPPSLVMIYYLVAIFLFFRLSISLFRRIYTAERKKDINLVKDIVLTGVFILLTMPSLYYIYQTTENIFPWTLMKAQESIFYAISVSEYLFSIGPVLLLGVAGFFLLRKAEQSLLVIWVLWDIVMIPLSKFIAFTPLPFKIPTLANIRFLSMTVYLPLAICAVIFLDYIKKRFGKSLFSFLVISYLILTFIMYPESLDSQLHEFAGLKQFMYPSEDLVSAYKFLGDHDTGGAVISNPDSSLLLPVFAKNSVYAGQSIYTNENGTKENQSLSILQGKMEECTAYKLLIGGSISYILTVDSSEEKRIINYNFARSVFKSGSINVFSFEPQTVNEKLICKS